MAKTHPKTDTNPQRAAADPGEVADRPEVETLVRKAQAGKGQELPHGAVRTGGDTAGGGGTMTLGPEAGPSSKHGS
jgi:hypothetical protein